MNIEEQINFLRARSVDFVSEEGLRKKLEKPRLKDEGFALNMEQIPLRPIST